VAKDVVLRQKSGDTATGSSATKNRVNCPPFDAKSPTAVVCPDVLTPRRLPQVPLEPRLKLYDEKVCRLVGVTVGLTRGSGWVGNWWRVVFGGLSWVTHGSENGRPAKQTTIPVLLSLLLTMCRGCQPRNLKQLNFMGCVQGRDLQKKPKCYL